MKATTNRLHLSLSLSLCLQDYPALMLNASTCSCGHVSNACVETAGDRTGVFLSSAADVERDGEDEEKEKKKGFVMVQGPAVGKLMAFYYIDM